ncbi:putative envelope protein [Streptococcus phage phiNJ2]|nr:tail length tape measure protein [Streptococcus phage phiNJ2]AFU88670.1 putative envelope protein [Streptococcus phage phiNJ2]
MLGANLVSGALIGGFTALGGAVKNVFSSAIDEGAKLQQSLGGIDTLFKNSADTVKNYASNAYKTAGLSANEYMENVTSFSASLISSLGGDTAAAAELANRAMTDMSDNANKMGTDMQAITGTYQSLARGNYAMLDNLKLGYGGTKAEMERLIKDASSYKDIQDELGISVEEGNMSFANMVKAISVVQKKLDITGTTMKEASTTFSGSLSMMKGAFNDFLGNLTTGGDITKPLQSLAESASTFFFGNFIPMIANVFKGLPTALSTFIASAKPALVNGLKGLLPEDALNSVTKVIDLITFSISDMVMAFQDFYQGFEKTGAIKVLSSALSELLTAGLDLSEKLSGIIPWETIGAAAGHVVKFIAQIIQSVAKFSQSMSGDAWRGVVTGIGGALVAFKAFNFLKSFNPFNLFKQNATSGVSGATSVVRSASASVVSIIRSLGKSVATAARGIGQGIGAAFRGIGQGLAMVNPATIAALAVPILALGAAFSLMGMQGQGIATILQGVGSVIVSVGTAIGTILNLALQGLAQALVIVAPVLPTIASAFAMLSPVIIAAGAAISMIVSSFSSLAPVITALGTALSQVITAISSGIAQIATAVTPIVAIISNAFVQVVTVVSQAIVEIIQALAPFIPAVSEMVQAVAPVLQALVEAFNNLISQISPIIDSIANLFKTLGEQITSILDSVGGVVESFGSAIRNVLDGIAGIFDSIGNAALNAGKGFNQLAQGIERITKLNLLDMGASLAAVAAGLGAIGATSGGLISAGSSLSVIVQGLMTVQSVSAIASSSLASLGNVAVSAMSMLVAGVQLAVSGTKSGMTQIVNAISLSANQMIQAGKQAGDGTTKGVVTGIRSGIGQAGGAMHAMMIAIRDTGMQGVSSMRVVGSMISQGLAQGMMSSIGSVTAAANALVAQAERAAKAKAQIHSPSRLFRDAIGRFLPMGVAVGIEKNTKYVDKAMDGMYEHINAFNYKAEDVIGVGKTKLSKVVQVKSDLESAIKATVEVAKEKSNNLVEKALDIAEKAVQRPAEMILDDGTLVAKTGGKYATYHAEQTRRENRMKGIIT